MQETNTVVVELVLRTGSSVIINALCTSSCTTHLQYIESNQHAKLKPATYVNCTDSQLIRLQEKTELTLSNDRDRFAWSHHQLYRTKSKEELAKLCRNMKLQSNGNKHELVKTLAENSDSVSHMLPSTMESWTPFQNNRH